MLNLPESLQQHRVSARNQDSVCVGEVRYSPIKSLWFLGMASGAIVGGPATFTWAAFGLFLGSTACVLLLGHSLGSHRKLIHNSFQCPKWLEYALVYCGVQVGLAGPLGLMRQHELRDYAQRLPSCHNYLRHGSSFWIDAWWQLNCELHLANPPEIRIEARVAEDRFYRFLENTWMLQHLPWVLLFYAWGGWAFVFWGVCARVTAGVFGHWLIGYFAHNQGGMHYEVLGAAAQGRNIRCASLLTMGECWHNNHHAFPGSARLGLFPGEWDPGWWVLMALHRFGLAWDFRLPEQLPPRPELEAIDAAAKRWDAPQGNQAPERSTLAGLIKLCMRRLETSTTQKPIIEWPAATLSVRALRFFLGRYIELRHDPAARRLLLRAGDSKTCGLPGLCLAFAQRNFLSRAFALVLLPFAVGFENLRTKWDVC